MLKIDNIDVAYGDVQVLFGVSLDIQEGELVAVIGANGAGGEVPRARAGLEIPETSVVSVNSVVNTEED